MPFCASCGSNVEGKYCPKCGTPVQGATPSSTPTGGSADLPDNLASALCYALWIVTGILFLFLEPYNRNRTIRFHAMQSILTFVALVIGSICLQLITTPLSYFNMGWGLMWGIYRLYGLVWIGVWIFLMYKAYKGERFVVPVIGPIAEKQA